MQARFERFDTIKIEFVLTGKRDVRGDQIELNRIDDAADSLDLDRLRWRYEERELVAAVQGVEGVGLALRCLPFEEETR